MAKYIVLLMCMLNLTLVAQAMEKEGIELTNKDEVTYNRFDLSVQDPLLATIVYTFLPNVARLQRFENKEPEAYSAIKITYPDVHTCITKLKAACNKVKADRIYRYTKDSTTFGILCWSKHRCVDIKNAFSNISYVKQPEIFYDFNEDTIAQKLFKHSLTISDENWRKNSEQVKKVLTEQEWTLLEKLYEKSNPSYTDEQQLMKNALDNFMQKEARDDNLVKFAKGLQHCSIQ
jgi:hypothetical protein